MREITPGFWEWNMAEHRVLGLEFGRRMTVAKLPDGTLWLHSPIAPTVEVTQRLSALGPVSSIVVPNTVHDAYLLESQGVWPKAKLYGAPGLEKANKKLRVDETLSSTPPPTWAATFDQHVMAGMPLVNEVVFLHKRSRTVIIADLAFYFADTKSAFSRFAFRLYGLYGKFKPSVLERMLIRDKTAFRASLEFVLTWDFDRILIGHGRNIETGGKSALKEAYSFLWKRS